MFELQSKWVAGVLSGRITLPTKEEMLEDVKAWYSELKSAGWPKRYTHNMTNKQFPVSPTKSDLDREQGERDPYHWLSAAFGIDDALPPALGAFSSFYPAEDVDSPGVSVGVAPGGGSIPASSDGYGFSSAMTETDETVHRVEE
ncbi:hypothetical protein GW17_00021320 [Ensete ventricosum]|nr:hypothetical protein GW17_00021320 [Ensete ventricosum]RZS16534.1 hypothetical protein BHM03_00048528 [Ensete ventricosum]